MSIAVVSDRNGEYDKFLAAVHDTLVPFSARPHWGKMHYFDAAGIRDAFPQVDAFKAVRQDFDPQQVFANKHLFRLLQLEALTS